MLAIPLSRDQLCGTGPVHPAGSTKREGGLGSTAAVIQSILPLIHAKDPFSYTKQSP